MAAPLIVCHAVPCRCDRWLSLRRRRGRNGHDATGRNATEQPQQQWCFDVILRHVHRDWAWQLWKRQGGNPEEDNARLGMLIPDEDREAVTVRACVLIHAFTEAARACGRTLCEQTAARVVLVALLLACKTESDRCAPNAAWAHVGASGTRSCKDLNELERAFLTLLDHRLLLHRC